MKKFLLSLAVLFSSVAYAQQYRHDEMVEEIEEGVEYLLVADVDENDKGRYFTQDSWNYLTTTANDSAKVMFVSVGDQNENGDDLYALMFVASQQYVKDQKIVGQADGSDMLNNKKPYIFTTSNIEEAAKWTVKLAETRYRMTNEEEGYLANWSTWSNEGEGEDSAEDVEAGIQNKTVVEGTFVLMNKNTNDLGTIPVYLESENEYVMFAHHGQNAWFIYTPIEMSAGEILDEYMIELFPEGVVNYYVGDCPGQYDEASVNVVKEVYAKYEAYILDGEGDPEEILAEMKEAIKNLVIHEMREGYYYIQPNRQVPPNSGKAGLIFDEGGAIRAQEFARPEVLTVEASKYIWYFKPAAEEDVIEAFAEPKENAYYIQNYGTSKWATNVVEDLTGNGERTFTTGDKAAVYVFEYLSVIPGTVYIYTHQSKGQCTGEDGCPYCAAWNLQNHGKHWILKWNARWDEGNMMFLYPVAQEEVDAIRDQVVQYDINERLKAVVSAAKSSYNRGITYAPAAECTKDDNFASHGYLTYSVDSVDVEVEVPAEEEGGESTTVIEKQAVVKTNVTPVDNNGADPIHPSDGQGLGALFDNDPATFAHTYWSGTAYPHFFEVDLGEGNELEAISMKMMRRVGTSEHNANFGFGEAKIFVRNTADEEWAEAGNLVMTYNINLYERAEDGSIATDPETGEPVLKTWSADNGENYVGVGAVGLGGKYRYLRVQHYKGIAGAENTYFSASEWALFGASYAPELSLNGAVPQELIDALLAEIAKAEAELAEGKGTEGQIVALQAAYDAYLAQYPDPTRLNEAITAAKAVLTNIAGATDSIGDKGAGYYPLASVEAYAAVVTAAEAGIKPVMTLDEINAALAQLEAAYETLMKSLVMPEVGQYYRIRSSAAETNQFHESIIYARGGDNNKDGIVPGLVRRVGSAEEGYSDNATIATSINSLWIVEEVKDNTVAIRNIGTGLYLQNKTQVNNNHAVLGTEKTFVSVQADGLTRGGNFNFIMGTDSVSGKTLFMNTMGSNYLCGWHSAAGTDHSSFRLETASLEEYTYGAYGIEVGENAYKAVSLPVNAKFLYADAYVYKVEGYCAEESKLYFTPIADMEEVAAGTPMYVVTKGAGTNSVVFYTAMDTEVLTSINDLTFGYESKEVNGFVSTVFSEEMADGTLYFTNFGTLAPAESTTESDGSVTKTRSASFSGYINGKAVPALEAAPEGFDAEDLMTGFAIEVAADVMTSIEGVEVELQSTAKNGVYTISGVRLNSTKNLPAGLYIINGKKVIK